MSENSAIATQVTLSGEAQNALMAAADYGEKQWLRVARITASELAMRDGVPKMAMYSEIAKWSKTGADAVRAWHGLYRDVGEDLILEFESVFGIAHWRIMIPCARRSETVGSTPKKERADMLRSEIARIAMEWAATADDYSGMPIPVDALAAKLGKPKDKRTDWEKAVDAAQRAATRLLRHAPNGQRVAARTIASAIEDLANDE